MQSILKNVESAEIMQVATVHTPTSSVLFSLWKDLIKPYLPWNLSQGTDESNALWQCIPEVSRRLLIQQKDEEDEQKARLDIIVDNLRVSLRSICVPELEESVLRVIGVCNELLPDLETNYCNLSTGDILIMQDQADNNSWLKSPFQKDRFERLHAKCMNMNDERSIVPIEHSLTIHSMYSALLHPHHCYDDLRRSFFLSRNR